MIKATKLLLNLDNLNQDQRLKVYDEIYNEVINDPLVEVKESEKKILKDELDDFHAMNELHHYHFDLLFFAYSIITLGLATVEFHKEYMFNFTNILLIVIGFSMLYLSLRMRFPVLDHQQLLFKYRAKWIGSHLREAPHQEHSLSKAA
ncbi:MAG: hypothetical protein BM556_10570 [Bacteriovorax sp. MedPE-SWde]|nr:MAG: hypothetical protein BM556_10570 [Bacteriovorax sp. MedPE-SWde]